MRYLYYYSVFHNDIFRVKVSRETESNIWISFNEGQETKISKKYYKTGSGYGSTKYYEETPEYLEKYMKSKMKRDFIKKLESLKSCTDENIIHQILLIEIPKQT